MPRTWTKPLFLGMVVGAIATMFVGFYWGGWVTGGTAEKMAADQTSTAVVEILLPSCVERAKADSAKFAEFVATNGDYNKIQVVKNSGWATFLPSTKTNEALAKACASALTAN